MTKTIRQTVFLMSCLIAAALTSTEPVRAADMFWDAATTADLRRDVHVVRIGDDRVSDTYTSDGQNTGISNYQFGVRSNIWNNERNQVLASIEYGRREFDRKIVLPDGFAVPERLNNVSAAFLYKHITSSDWSISQSVRYTKYWTDDPSVTVRDTIDIVGMVAVSHEPGVVWVLGYIYDQMDDTINHLYPLVAYVNNAHDRWTLMVGYPVLTFTFSPHPDWLGAGGAGGASIAYKVTEQNRLRLSYADDNWAYRLTGPDVKGVAYTSHRTNLDWTYLYFIDHRTVAAFNASLGWEFSRKLGTDNKLTMSDAAVLGLNASLSF